MQEFERFLTGTWGEMKGNVALILATGRTAPTEAAPHGKLRVNDPYWFKYPEQMPEMLAFCEANAHRDLYLTPATYGDEPFMATRIVDGEKVKYAKPFAADGRPLYTRAKSNALQCQTIYMDSDSCPPEKFRLAPSRHVDTSDGHGHDYWILTEPVPASEAAEIAHRITTAHAKDGCDPSGWSENKVLRVPTVNTTYDETFPFELQWYESGEVYLAEDVSGAYDDVQVSASAAASPTKEMPPVPKLEGLPSFEELATKIPAAERRLTDLIYKTPKTGEKGWRSEQRFALELDLLRFGFSAEEAVAMVWYSPSGSKFREDDRGLEGIWWEINERALPIVLAERGTPSTEIAVERTKESLKILKPAERRRFEERSDMVTLYNSYVRTKVPVFNAPLHHMNAWTLLSIALIEVAGIPRPGKLMPLNFYSISIVESSAGKTESKDILKTFVRVLYPQNNPDIGADHSKSALIEQLIERSGRASWLNDDEFHGTLGAIEARAGGTQGIIEAWTKIYDGDVPSMARVGRLKELNTPDLVALPVFHAMGNPTGMFKVLTKEMFYSGYLARNIFVLGMDIPTTEESLRHKVVDVEDLDAYYEAVPKYFASRFNQMRAAARVKAGPRSRVAIGMTDEAVERFSKAKWDIWQHFESHWDMGLWRTSIRRMYDIILKAAALNALTEGRTFIATKDLNTALGYAEIWLETLVEVSERISDTHFSKQCDDIEKFISTGKMQQREVAEIYNFRRGEKVYEVDLYLQSLLYQKRLTMEQLNASAPRHYRIRGVGK